MLACDAYVHPGIIHTGNRSREPVRHEGAFHADDDVDRSIDCPRNLNAGQPPEFASDGPGAQEQVDRRGNSLAAQ
jgi:hypothetical protein